MSVIVQVANFVAPRSGGLKTTLAQLALGYAERGHTVIQVVPGATDLFEPTDWGARATVRAPIVPGTGYRLIVDRRAVQRLIGSLQPDRLEVHDRTTLRGLGRWAAGVGLPALVVSHERLDQLLAVWSRRPPGPPRRWATGLADRTNLALARSFDHVVVTTGWAGAEYVRLAIDNLVTVPLGVDLQSFRPDQFSARVRERLAPRGESLLLVVSRLSPEKRVDLAVAATAELVRRGRPVRLVVIGDGPSRRSLERRAAGLPVRFLGHLDDRHRLATILACADVAIAPGPVETFGLAALEALASGTPIVVNAASALPEVLGRQAGLAVEGTPTGFADGVQGLLDGPGDRRQAARRRAEEYGWDRSVDSLLQVHGLPVPAAGSATRLAQPE